MRAVRYSITFNDQFNALLDYSDTHFGSALTDEKKTLVYTKIESFLARYTSAKRPDPNLGLHVYTIRKTPFMVVYDFDDAELRLHFIFNRNASLADLDPRSAQW